MSHEVEVFLQPRSAYRVIKPVGLIKRLKLIEVSSLELLKLSLTLLLITFTGSFTVAFNVLFYVTIPIHSLGTIYQFLYYFLFSSFEKQKVVSDIFKLRTYSVKNLSDHLKKICFCKGSFNVTIENVTIFYL